MKEITWEQFEQQYFPMQNHIDTNASFGGYMFETYGAEYDHVMFVYNQKPECVWTVMADTGNVDITSGLHFVNRLGYIITEAPADDDFINVIDEDYEEDEPEPEPSLEEMRDDNR